MKRILSLTLILATSLGAYFIFDRFTTRDDAQALLKTCKTRSLGEAAVAACDKLLDQDGLAEGARGSLLFRKAYAFGYLGDDDAAEAVYSQAANYRSGLQRASLHNRALIYSDRGDFEAMEADAKRLIADWPEMRDRNYFGALRMLRRKADADEDLQRSEELAALYLAGQPQDMKTLLRRIAYLENNRASFPKEGVQLTRLGDLTRAIAELPDGLDRFEFYKKRFDLLLELGLAVPASQDGLKWLEYFVAQEIESIGARGASGAEVASLKAEVEARRNTIAEIRQNAELSASSDAKGVTALLARAQARYVLGDVQRALTDLKAAQALGHEGGLAGFSAEFLTQIADLIEGSDLAYRG